MAKCGFIERDLENGTATCKGCGNTVDIPLKISAQLYDAKTSYQVNEAYKNLGKYIHDTKINKANQTYKGVVFRFYGNATAMAARFVLFNSNQNVWIPKKHFDKTMTLKPGENIDYIMLSWQTKHKVKLARGAANNG